MAGPPPAPHVEVFADAVEGRTLPPAAAPQIVAEEPNYDGCDSAYSDGEGVCVPLVFPSGTQDKCRWLEEHGFGPLPIPGPDPQRLAPPDGPRARSGAPFACPGQLGVG